MTDLLEQLVADPLTNNAIIAVTALAILGFVLGTVRAIADKTFTWDAIDIWVRKTLMGRVIPIILILAFGRVVGSIQIGEADIAILTGAGLAAAATYAAAEIASIVASLNRARENPIPTE